MMQSILFAEWIAENHYVLINVVEGIHYWQNEQNIKTTKELFEFWIENYNS